MIHLRTALCLAMLPLCALRLRADDSGDHPQAPEEIPDFSTLDEYTYVPKTTLNMGFRFIFTGPKTSFWGRGTLPAPEMVSSANVANIARTYHDGTVSSDGRTVSVDDGNGGATSVSVPSDGKTNTWSYVNQSQIGPDGNMNFHVYSATISDPTAHNRSGVANNGVELVAARDMGSVGKHLTWSITAGFSITDIRSTVFANVAANVTTLTDTYDLYGQMVPAAPYSSPGTITQTVVNSSGAALTSSTSTTVSQSYDTTVLLGNQPINRSTSTVATNNAVTNIYNIEGAYYTFRAGPTLSLPFWSRFKLSLSAGPALLYAGTSFAVEEYLLPPTGDPVVETIAKSNSHLLIGYYADLSLQYNLTDTAGFYLSALYEGAGSYNQSVGSADVTYNEVPQPAGQSSYSTRINFDNQSGVRAGMTVKF
jgi:hypothetical protein